MTDKNIVPTTDEPIVELGLFTGSALQTLDFNDVGRVFSKKMDVILKNERALLDQAGRVEVTNRDQFRNAGDLYKMINSPVKSAEELRTSWTGPINKGLKQIKKLVDERKGPWTKALEHINAKMGKWGREEENRIKAEQDRLRKEAEEKALKEAQEKEAAALAARKLEQDAASVGDDSTALAAAEIARTAEQERDEALEAPGKMPTADSTVRRVHGFYGSTLGMKNTWKVKSIDIRQLSDSCITTIMHNEKAMNAIRIALAEHIEPRLTKLRDGKQIEPLHGVVFEQDSNPSIR